MSFLSIRIHYFALICVLSTTLRGDPIQVGQVLGFTPGIRGAVELVFNSTVGTYYQVQISADMATWDNEGYAVKGTGGQISVLARTRNLTAAYYRLRDDGVVENLAPIGPPGPQGVPGADGAGIGDGLSVQGANHLVNSQTYSTSKAGLWLTDTEGGSPPLRGFQFGDSLSTGFAPGPNMARAGIIGLGLTNVVGPVIFHGSAGAGTPFRFDFWINGQATEFGVGSSAEFVEDSRANGDIRGTEAFIAYIVRPGGGSFDLEYQKNATGGWSKLATINTYGSAVASVVRTFPLSGSSSPFYRLRATNVVSSSCVILFTGIYATDGGGVIWMPVGARGGIDLVQSITTPSEILDPVWSALAPDFVLTCWADAAAEWLPGGAFRQFYDHANTVHTSTDWILISANPALDETGRPEQRAAQIEWAMEAGQTWINGYAMFRDFATATARGLMYDGVHLNAAGQQARNAHLWNALPLGQISLGGTLATGSGTPVIQVSPISTNQNSPVEFTRPVAIRSGAGALTLYDRTNLLDSNRAWSLFNEFRDLKFYHAGSNALVLSTSVDTGAHPGNDGFKLGKMNQRWRGWFSGLQAGIVTKTVNYALSVNDHTVLGDASSGAVTFNLPSATLAEQGRIYIVKKIDPSANSVTITAFGSQTIDGSPSVTLISPFQFAGVQSSGSAWFIISR